MDLGELEPEKVYEAIRQGVCDAIFRVATNGTDMPSADFYDSIKDGVKAGLLANKKAERYGPDA